jgi:hypothetical protein
MLETILIRYQKSNEFQGNCDKQTVFSKSEFYEMNIENFYQSIYHLRLYYPLITFFNKRGGQVFVFKPVDSLELKF